MTHPLLQDPQAVFLVDLSGYIFRAYHAIQNLRTKDNRPTGAIFGVTRMLAKLLADRPEATIVAVKDAPGGSWRHEVYADYKANRPPPPEDLAVQFAPIGEIVEAMGIPTIVQPGHEADDLIAELVERLNAEGRPVVVISADKDLLQMIGPRTVMWDPVRDTVYDAAAVAAKWGVGPEAIADMLALMGDSSDNVPGVPGIGKKRAGDLLQTYGSIAALLEQLDELPKQKWAENLRADPEAARLSLRLVKLPSDRPSGIEPTALERTPPDPERLAAMFREHEFFTLLEQLPQMLPHMDEAAAAAAQQSGSQLDDVEIATVTDAGDVAAWLSGDAPLGFDTETTDLLTQRAAIVGLSLSDGARAAYVPVAHRDGPNADWAAIEPALRTWAEDPAKPKWGQNLKYDLQVLRRAGIELRGIAGDAMLASYLLNPDVRGHGLDALAERELDHRTIHFADVAPDGEFAAVAVADAARYAAEDALVAHRLCTKLHARLHDEGLWDVYTQIELPLVPVLGAMEWHGIAVDRAQLAALREELNERLTTLETEIHAAAGREFNVQSPKQIGEVLFDELGLASSGVRRTKTGAWSTDANVLEGLVDAHPIVPQMLEHRMLAKLQGTYVEALDQAVLPETGRIHPQFHQAIAATGRLSCNNPNLQNIPIRDAWGHRIRAAFVPAPGYVFVDADYSQIELRILAHLTGDPGLVAAFQAGDDIHARTASEVFDVLPGMLTAEQRRAAKAINFGLMYGMGAQTLGRNLGIGTKEASRYIERYFARYPKVREFRERTVAQARQDGYVTTMFGRRRWIPDLTSGNPRLEAQGERIAINTPIQGTAADIIKRAMIEVDRRLRAELPGTRLLLQVHDELLLEAPEAQADTAQALLVAAMQNAAELAVPLLVEAHSGANWDAAHG